jgi:GT2 family glycosyltransferase
MIYYSIPYDSGKNLGVYYNSFMDLLSHEDFACFLDGDVIFTTTFFGSQLQNIINTAPDCGLFYCLTNRIGCPWQRANVDRMSNDMSYHRTIGKHLAETEATTCKDVSKETFPASGPLILVKKSLWEEVGKFHDQGMLGVDNDFFRKAQSVGAKILLMEGVYVYHWYRNNNPLNVLHLL